MAAKPLTVCVTGASGFIASHIVKICLERGHTVRGTVRDAGNEERTRHLLNLPGATERLQLFSAELMKAGSFDEAVSGCDGVFHAASPLPMGKGAEDPENIVIKPAVEGTMNVLRSCLKAEVLSVVLTSSMSAMAPDPEPAVKTVKHWSDPEQQRSKGSFYGAGKTLAERAAVDFAKTEMPYLRLVRICPTMVLGPMLQPEPNMTMLAYCNWLKGGRSTTGICPNDSMSFVDVRDCAQQHVAAMENQDCLGRYMSLDSSYHWNDLVPIMREIYPSMPDCAPCEDPCQPTQFDMTPLMGAPPLGVTLRKAPEILRDAAEELKIKGLLD
eukprot:TRINITY_DN47611_c0_g1_i1.p1 TRINITY_DN47611_c0_g1~~TRINITY_DN47611_c0_g1_i1.p1  ORF type:complete len:327 (-),score=65.76 TRINITY_DN47611_c0_g1_i1:214-1194(-)